MRLHLSLGLVHPRPPLCIYPAYRARPPTPRPRSRVRSRVLPADTRAPRRSHNRVQRAHHFAARGVARCGSRWIMHHPPGIHLRLIPSLDTLLRPFLARAAGKHLSRGINPRRAEWKMKMAGAKCPVKLDEQEEIIGSLDRGVCVTKSNWGWGWRRLQKDRRFIFFLLARGGKSCGCWMLDGEHRS